MTTDSSRGITRRKWLRSSAILLLALIATPAGAQQSRGQARHDHAEALLRKRLPCLGCHRLRGVGGRIGPDLSAVGLRLTPAEIRRMIVDPAGRVPGTIMPKVPMPAPMLEDIVRYLSNERALPGGAIELVQRPRIRAEASAAERWYGQYCAVCHGARGRGDGPNALYVGARVTAHSDKRLMSRKTDDRLYDAIYAGGYFLNGSGRMPPFGESLTHDQISALVHYLRVLCDCRGPEWSRDGQVR